MAELEPLSDDLRALLDAETRREEPPPGAGDRVLLRLGASFGPALPLGHPAGMPSRGAKRMHTVHGARLAAAVRVATVFVAGAASGIGGIRAIEHIRRHEVSPAPPVVAARATASVSPPVAETVAPPAESAAASITTPSPRVRRPATAPVPEEDDVVLAHERSLLEIARAALVRGQADGALAALGRHEAAFPRGELTEEREGLFVQALVAARRYGEARARAALFTRRYPRSLFAPVVAEALRSIP